ncbi:LysR family transcriptional regulator [Pseudonocardia spinosispora]|uniref:LysR family transcriptional regulator n=1 Tax=Pseudonocardia spinosispora TaxID=103441 RepID=UPI0009FFB520|nr:LysR family transcriptional regulator [Pseudonocardia spinosispora]
MPARHRRWSGTLEGVEPEIELRHFRYVLAVAEEGTFTGAAARLGMTQPALSRAIRAVETMLGADLFVRDRHGATLTDAGRALRDDARAVDDAARAAVTRATAARGTRQLRVTARACDIDALEALVVAYNAEHPGRVRAAVVDGSAQVEEVRTGVTDVTLVRSPMDFRGLDSDLFRADPRVALLPDDHPLATRRVIERAELDGATIPTWSGDTPAQTAYWTGTDLAPHAWTPGPSVSDAAQYVAGIRLGGAIGFVPESLLPELVLRGISVVQVAGLSASELRIVWAPSATSQETASFVRHATR